MADMNKIKRIEGGTLKTVRAQDATIPLNVQTYSGPYTVTPTTEQQTLNTRNRILSANVTVEGVMNDYDGLVNKPQVNGVTLQGNKSLEDLGIASAEDVQEKYTKPDSGIPASDIADGVIPDVSGFYTKPAGGIPAADIADGVIPDVSGFYEKPETGIPATDIADGVIPDVSGFYTKPAAGIPASDIASGVIPDVTGKLDAPSTAGTQGQVLTSDGNGGQTWEDPQGGGSNITDTASGAIASFADGADGEPMESVRIKIEPAQSGSGTPSPSNVRPIIVWTEANVVVSPTQDAEDGTTYTISLTQAGTVYGGELDVTNGTLTVDRAMLTFDGSSDEAWNVWSGPKAYYVKVSTSGATNPQRMMSDAFAWKGIYNTAQMNIGEFLTNASTVGDAGIWNGNISFKYDANADNLSGFKTWLSSNPIHVVYKITPVTYSLTPTEITSLLGQNNVWADTGDTAVTYRADTQLYIDKKAEEAELDLSGIIAPEETTNKASQSYSVGSMLIYNDTLYKVTSSISSGGTITPGSNVTATTMEEIAAAKYTKPSGGIPATDLASGVIPDVSGKLDAPAAAGTSGQVLTSDGQGGQSWQTPSGGGLSNEVKEALLACFEKVAWTDGNGQSYYDALFVALYGYWRITNDLSDCTTSNDATHIEDGDSYSAVITAATGYTMEGAAVSVKMGGTDITSTAYSNGVISIASVTGALDISAAAVYNSVVSISAAFTQSGTVYDTDSLDSLKTGLVVTATLVDTSTITVPSNDYTLTGALYEGTRTITVEYGGETATFTATVTANAHYYNEVGLGWDVNDSTKYVYKKTASTNKNRMIRLADAGVNEIVKGTGTSEQSLGFSVYPLIVPPTASTLTITLPSTIAVAANFVKWTGTKYILATNSAAPWNFGVSTYDISAINDGNLFVGMLFKNQADSSAINTADTSSWTFVFS